MSLPEEEQRRRTAGALEVTLYTRPGCHLCEEAKAVVEPLLREWGEKLQEVNIDLDPELAQRYGSEIPVIFIGSHKAAKHRVNSEQFRKQLEQARARKDPSPGDRRI